MREAFEIPFRDAWKPKVSTSVFVTKNPPRRAVLPQGDL
jgi:hypothetical protein